MVKTISYPVVRRIAATAIDNRQIEYINSIMETETAQSDAENLVEFAGRSCYQSFDKPNPATRGNADYIANIIRQGHESVLEHASVTYYIQGISRSCTHEIVRHRHFSFSQQSQRFVDESGAAVVLPPAASVMRTQEETLRDFFGEYDGSDTVEATIVAGMKEAQERYEDIVENLQARGLPRKQAREAARAVLPGGTETRLVITGNHRTWREFLNKRLAPGADAEIRQLANLILEDLYTMAPAIYQDVWESNQGGVQ